MGDGTTTARDRKIVRMHVDDHMSFREISDRVGLTPEGVRKIIRRNGVTSEQTAEVVRARRREKLVSWECARPGCDTRRDVMPSVADARTYCSKECAALASRYSDDELLSYLRTVAAEVGGTPSRAVLDAADGPSTQIYYERFGTLTAAQEAAGLVPNPVGGGGPVPLPDGFTP